LDDFESGAVRRLRSLKAAERRIGMGETIQLRIEMTEEEFLARWKKECEEWSAISEELQETARHRASHSPGHEHEYVITAWDVSDEQRIRMAQRGEKPLDMGRIYIKGRGWLIER
jgi:hypothetical protein